MQRRRRLNPTEDQERRAAAVMRDPDLDFDMAIDLANRILAGEEVAEALAGTGLVVDMSPRPAQIAEIETSRGVIEVPVKESAPPTVVNWFRVETSAPGAGFKQLYRQRRGSRTSMGFDTLAEAVKEAEHTLAIGDGDGYDVQTVRILRVDVDPETEEEIPNTGTVVWESSSRTSTPTPVVEYFPGSHRPSLTEAEVNKKPDSSRRRTQAAADLFKALDAETKRIATVAFVALSHPDNMFQAVYLYFLPNKLTFAVLRDDETPSPGWQLAMPDRLPRNLTEDQLRYRIQTIAQRLPLFPNE